MIYILHYLKGPELVELWNIPYSKYRIYITNRIRETP